MPHSTTPTDLLAGPKHPGPPLSHPDEHSANTHVGIDDSSYAKTAIGAKMDYPAIPGTSPFEPLALEDGSIPTALTSPSSAPKRGGKNMFAFWDTGIRSLRPYLIRNVVSWYQRYASLGWNIYVLDRVEDSPLNVARFIDFSDPKIVPDVMREKGSVSGQYAAQHSSDLIRYPMLLKYGGVYLDVGILLFGDVDLLWEQHIGNAASPVEYAGFTMSDAPEGISIVNFFMMATPDNPLVQRAHSIFLKLWEGKTDTTGAHAHPLVSHVPLLRVPDNLSQTGDDKDKMAINDEAMTDYAVQIQAMGSAQRWVDVEAGWNGPEYVRNNCWLMSMIQHAYVNEQLTGWDSAKQHRIFKTLLPKTSDECETKEQRLGRQIVEESVAGSWALKLAHGFSAKLFGAPTLGMLWKADDGSDCGEGTYGGWLRWATVHLKQNKPPARLIVEPYEPTITANLASML